MLLLGCPRLESDTGKNCCLKIAAEAKKNEPIQADTKA